MTDQAAVYRPSPRPRPAGEPSRPVDRPDLRVVPRPADPDEAEIRKLQPETVEAPAPSITFPQVNGSDGANADTEPGQVSGFRASIKAAAARTGAYWTPPALLTEQPASLAELADYARSAPWTAQRKGAVRKAGIVYGSGLALPYTAVSRYREWVVQRPLRLAAHIGGIKLLAQTTPGIWVVDHLVYPVVQFAGHLFL